MNMDYHNMKKERPKKEKLEISTGTLRKILYIGELPPNTDQYFLYQLIMEKGNFTVDSITTKNTKDNKSYAYVKFGNEKEALKAKEILHLSNINGYVIRTNIFNKHLEKNDNLIGNLFIKNLPENLTSKELCDIFQEFGDISSIKLRQGVKGECQGQGYVQFSNELDAEKAMEKLNGCDIKGKQIVIEKFHEKKKRKMEGEDRSTIIFFQQLPISIQTENQLEKILNEFGKILFISLFKNKLSNTNNALVIFEKQSEAKSCVIKLQNTSVSEGDITFKMTLSPSKEEIEDFSKSKNENFKQRYLNCNLIVKNLPKTMNDRELFEIFREFGEISKAIIPTEGKFVTKLNENGDVVDKEYVYESKGFGFVCFKKTESAELAINNLNGKNLKGKFQDFKVNVEYYNYDRSTEPKEKPQVNKGFHNKKKYGKKNQFHNNNNNANWNENQIKNQHSYQNNQNYGHMKNYGQSYPQYQNVPYNIKQDNRQKYMPQANVQKMENPFVYELINILNSNDENKREILGEQIFYYIKNLLAVTKINNTKNDDEKLCARFTGIFLNSNQNDLIEIFRYEETLIKTLKDIIYELQKDSQF